MKLVMCLVVTHQGSHDNVLVIQRQKLLLSLHKPLLEGMGKLRKRSSQRRISVFCQKLLHVIINFLVQL